MERDGGPGRWLMGRGEGMVGRWRRCSRDTRLGLASVVVILLVFQSLDGHE